MTDIVFFIIVILVLSQYFILLYLLWHPEKASVSILISQFLYLLGSSTSLQHTIGNNNNKVKKYVP